MTREEYIEFIKAMPTWNEKYELSLCAANNKIFELEEKLQNFTPKENDKKLKDAIERLDNVFYLAFETNHPAMLDWVTVKFRLKDLESI